MLDKMMKDDNEFDSLLDEIETSSFNLQAHLQYEQNSTHNVAVDHYGHASYMSVMPDINSHGLGQGYGVYDDDDEYMRVLSASPSPVTMNGGLVHSSRGSSSSGLFPGSLSLGTEDLSRPYLNGIPTDLEKANSGNLASYGNGFVDENISVDFGRKMCIGGGVRSPNRVVGMNSGRYRGCDDLRNTLPEYNGFSLPLSGRPLSRQGYVDSALLLEMQRAGSRFASPYSPGSRFASPYSPGLSDPFVSRSDYAHSSGLNPQYFRSNVVAANNSFPMGYGLSDVSSSRADLADTRLNRPRNGYLSDAYWAPNVMVPQCNEENAAFHYQASPLSSRRNTVPSHVRLSQGVEAFCGDDSLIIQGQGAANHGMKRHVRSSRGRESGAKIYSPLPQLAKCGSLADVKGCIYALAKDQNGCRFLQKVFDEGSPRDVHMIFGEIIDHVDELMTNAFGNYLMQKLLEVCNEEQRTHILLRVSKELVRISLNTHGTRVVQKLIETLKTRRQILLVVSALEPGFLALIKDLNGNHVIQKCLQSFSSEDSKFIYVAAAKYCVEIASHQHGCCVLQRCISHSTGEHQENLVARIAADGILLAQDAYGNYVIQYLLELQIPSALSKLNALFQNNYAQLSMQKFSSHVVEKCLTVCSDDVVSRIIHELLSATYFEHLLSDPHANYVVQTALQVSQGPLHNSLVDAIESHKAVSRNSPYSKRIFSHKLLKR